MNDIALAHLQLAISHIREAIVTNDVMHHELNNALRDLSTLAHFYRN